MQPFFSNYLAMRANTKEKKPSIRDELKNKNISIDWKWLEQKVVRLVVFRCIPGGSAIPVLSKLDISTFSLDMPFGSYKT